MSYVSVMQHAQFVQQLRLAIAGDTKTSSDIREQHQQNIWCAWPHVVHKPSEVQRASASSCVRHCRVSLGQNVRSVLRLRPDFVRSGVVILEKRCSRSLTAVHGYKLTLLQEFSVERLSVLSRGLRVAAQRLRSCVR